MWTPAVVLMVLLAVAAIALAVPRYRRYLRWWLPGFRESSLTNFASAMSLMLKSGGDLGETLDLARKLEAGSPAGAELEEWKRRLAAGHGKITEIAGDSRAFPPLFVWLLAQGGEDLAAGFRKAAEIYFARAMYKVELLLYTALPVSVLVLGVMILGQFLPLFGNLVSFIDSLGDMGGGGP
jgi:type II secretory pathway component PulF